MLHSGNMSWSVFHTPPRSHPRRAQGRFSPENLRDTPCFDSCTYLCEKHCLKCLYLVAKLWDSFFFKLTRQPVLPKNVFVLVGSEVVKIRCEAFYALNVYNMAGSVEPGAG